MSKRHYARIVGGPLPIASQCPNCLKKLEAVTAIALDGDFQRIGPRGRVSIKDHATRCGYCWALLVFADENGRLRMMTKEERGNYALHPLLARAIDIVREQTNPPDFTRKNYN